jgi:hypothetical protein
LVSPNYGTKIALQGIVLVVIIKGGAMKISNKIRVQTTLGELVSALWEETETLFKFNRNERQLVVAYVLNDLLTGPHYGSHRIAIKKR